MYLHLLLSHSHDLCMTRKLTWLISISNSLTVVDLTSSKAFLTIPSTRTILSSGRPAAHLTIGWDTRPSCTVRTPCIVSIRWRRIMNSILLPVGREVCTRARMRTFFPTSDDKFAISFLFLFGRSCDWFKGSLP